MTIFFKKVQDTRRAAIRVTIGLLVLWLAIAGYGIWKYASQETEPPVFDALSYVQKAQAFWAAVGRGHVFNPLALEPPIRPFGTVIFTHPYGFTADFRQFYFLSCFLPALLLVLAVAVAAGRAAWRNPATAWILGILLLISASLPSYFQFASAEGVPVMGTWGFVDTLFGALGALAIAFATRAPLGHWHRDTVISAFLAVLTILVKPAGLTLMLLIAGAWGLMALGRVVRGELTRKVFFQGLAVYGVVYGATAVILYNSPYFSRENYLYGLSSMKLLHQAMITVPTAGDIVGKLNLAFGMPFVVVLLFGMGFAARQKQWERLGVALVCLLGGTWLWLGQTNIDHVRYFFPFPVMALIVVVPSVATAAAAPSRLLLATATLLLLPTVAIGTLLLSGSPSQRIERIVGINLTTNLHPAEVAQARDLSQMLAAEPARQSTIYYSGVAPKVKAFEAVMDWNRVLGFKGGNSIPNLPIDWVREHAYRIDDMAEARFVVFEPYTMPPGASRYMRVVDTFDKEQLVVRAWLTTLGANDGVRVISDDGVRVLEVVDPFEFIEAATRSLLPNHSFRKVFLDGFSRRDLLLSTDALALPGNRFEKPLSLRLGHDEVARIDAVVSHVLPDGSTRFEVYVSQLSALPGRASGWAVFIHAMDDGGRIVGQGYAPYKSRLASRVSDVQYVLTIGPTERPPSRFAIGVFQQDPIHGDVFLLGEGGDWDGRRHIF